MCPCLHVRAYSCVLRKVCAHVSVLPCAMLRQIKCNQRYNLSEENGCFYLISPCSNMNSVSFSYQWEDLYAMTNMLLAQHRSLSPPSSSSSSPAAKPMDEAVLALVQVSLVCGMHIYYLDRVSV